MKIYFAAAMRGGRDNLKTNQQIVAHLAHLGHDALTLHVTDDDFAGGEAEMNDKKIYQRDMQLLAQAEAMIAEATTPSLGTGYEIAEALRQNIPVLCLHRTDTAQPFSALIAGIQHSRYRCTSYTNDGWKKPVEDFLRQQSTEHRALST